jgi:hypothetical protein
MCNGKGRPGNKTTSGKGNRGNSLTAIEEDEEAITFPTTKRTGHFENDAH